MLSTFTTKDDIGLLCLFCRPLCTSTCVMSQWWDETNGTMSFVTNSYFCEKFILELVELGAVRCVRYWYFDIHRSAIYPGDDSHVKVRCFKHRESFFEGVFQGSNCLFCYFEAAGKCVGDPVHKRGEYESKREPKKSTQAGDQVNNSCLLELSKLWVRDCVQNVKNMKQDITCWEGGCKTQYIPPMIYLIIGR